VDFGPGTVCPLMTQSGHSTCANPSASLRRRGEMRPFFHLHSGDELVGTALGAEKGGFALFDVKPILAESIDDIRLVRNKNRVGARRNVRYWPLADIPSCTAHVRFWG
jgi:hypothetical protein